MCGIVGFTGNHQAAPILLDGLSKLEYRGYDSAGLAVRDGEHLAQVVKAKGRLKGLSEKTNGGESVPGTCGIGHTRWATHGEPSEINAHPHYSDDKMVVTIHNGIIERNVCLIRIISNPLVTERTDRGTELQIVYRGYVLHELLVRDDPTHRCGREESPTVILVKT